MTGFGHPKSMNGTGLYQIAGYTASRVDSRHCRDVCWARDSRLSRCAAWAVAPYVEGQPYWRWLHAEHCLIYFEIPPPTPGNYTLKAFSCVGLPSPSSPRSPRTKAGFSRLAGEPC